MMIEKLCVFSRKIRKSKCYNGRKWSEREMDTSVLGWILFFWFSIHNTFFSSICVCVSVCLCFFRVPGWFGQWRKKQELFRQYYFVFLSFCFVFFSFSFVLFLSKVCWPYQMRYAATMLVRQLYFVSLKSNRNKLHIDPISEFHFILFVSFSVPFHSIKFKENIIYSGIIFI